MLETKLQKIGSVIPEDCFISNRIRQAVHNELLRYSANPLTTQRGVPRRYFPKEILRQIWQYKLPDTNIRPVPLLLQSSLATLIFTACGEQNPVTPPTLEEDLTQTTESMTPLFSAASVLIVERDGASGGIFRLQKGELVLATVKHVVDIMEGKLNIIIPGNMKGLPVTLSGNSPIWTPVSGTSVEFKGQKPDDLQITPIDAYNNQKIDELAQQGTIKPLQALTIAESRIRPGQVLLIPKKGQAYKYNGILTEAYDQVIYQGPYGPYPNTMQLGFTKGLDQAICRGYSGSPVLIADQNLNGDLTPTNKAVGIVAYVTNPLDSCSSATTGGIGIAFTFGKGLPPIVNEVFP